MNMPQRAAETFFPLSPQKPIPWPLRYFFKLLQLPFWLAIVIFLRPRRGKVGTLSPHEVQAVYDREAEGYDLKHTLTTCGRDQARRLEVGWEVASFALSTKLRHLRVLDLCTGTGLAVVEMARVLSANGRSADFVGVDLNAHMLAHARTRSVSSESTARFLRADVTDMVGEPGEFVRFPLGSFDVVTQVFGIGGVVDSGKAFEQVLALLVPGGRFVLTDIHQPIRELPGLWPVLGRYREFPRFEAACYRDTTVPLVLGRLWGWHDPTPDFTRVLQTLWQDAEGMWWGFRIVSRNFTVESWWFNLPLMPVGKLVLEKVRMPCSS